jgi:hypothetical protein
MTPPVQQIYPNKNKIKYTCNPTNSRSRDQEDQGSKPTWANSWKDPTSKKVVTKKG